MKQLAISLLTCVLILLLGGSVTFAQVKRVEMKIDGYLCGN